MALKALLKIHVEETPLMMFNFLESLTLNIQETKSPILPSKRAAGWR